MKEDLKQTAALIIKTVDEIDIHKNNFINAKKRIKELEIQLNTKQITKSQFNSNIDSISRGKTKDQFILNYEQKILSLFDDIESKLTDITSSISKTPKMKDNKEKQSHFNDEIIKNIDKTYIKDLVKKKKRGEELEIPDYILYKTKRYGFISNFFMEKFTRYLVINYDNLFLSLYKSLKSSGIPILSKTYISMMLLSTLLSFILSSILFFLIFQSLSIISIINSLLLGIIFSSSILVFFYYYPSIVSNNRRRKIKNDLPFVIVHMSAIAGSGANPISMFNLILTSGEFKGVEGEIKKIVNYVNLFGYNLSTSLKLVSTTTPSKEFREFLNGLVTNIETGGDLGQYLNAKASDAITTYKLDRKKYVDTLSTYSDVYTGVLIAAPLLFFATLAIIQVLGGEIFGITAKTIAVIGTFIVIPVMNIVYLLFINIIQPEV